MQKIESLYLLDVVTTCTNLVPVERMHDVDEHTNIWHGSEHMFSECRLLLTLCPSLRYARGAWLEALWTIGILKQGLSGFAGFL